jgi:hypothetical protein
MPYDAGLEKEREMSKLSRIGLLSVFVLAGLACGLISNPISGAQNFASTAEAIASSIPSALPSGMPNIPDVSKYMNPTGTPAKEWNGIPIMTQATAGQEFDSSTYSYKAGGIQATDIQTFYSDKLTAAGWSSTLNAFGGNAGGLMIFSKGSSTLTITVAQTDSDYLVLLVMQ